MIVMNCGFILCAAYYKILKVVFRLQRTFNRNLICFQASSGYLNNSRCCECGALFDWGLPFTTFNDICLRLSENEHNIPYSLYIAWVNLGFATGNTKQSEQQKLAAFSKFKLTHTRTHWCPRQC